MGVGNRGRQELDSPEAINAELEALWLVAEAASALLKSATEARLLEQQFFPCRKVKALEQAIRAYEATGMS